MTIVGSTQITIPLFAPCLHPVCAHIIAHHPHMLGGLHTDLMYECALAACHVLHEDMLHVCMSHVILQGLKHAQRYVLVV